MVNFVLVPGSWLGAWAWDEVAPALRAAGHGVHPLTLSGLAEQRDRPVGPQTHVRDIVDEVERLDLREVVLVGHSYAGIPVGQAAGHIGDRLRRAVFVDSLVPAEGGSFVSAWWEGPDKLAAVLAGSGGVWEPLGAGEFEGQDLDEEQIARFVSRATPHPGATLSDPARLARPLAELPATYIKCLLDGPEPTEDVARLIRDAGWRLRELNTGHWPMLSQPASLARLLLAETDA
ncbi:alpha/beta hydrolase [Streptomyces sp. TRM66268-LWL]|uniref:Alpha/beta hydrolase n=1 Tax=Streptomyces polyasparticus TaxID=2767826 RepID=A0ABR7SCS2_9ACTN|nr:alpha/beta hydrolase [Streptomyces polyasparticus]MBC9712540.1 alpha/beta hydrolase [Streptomyces polyasparticus]